MSTRAWHHARRPLPLLPLRGTVVFPGTRVTLLVGRPASLAAVRMARRGEGLLVLVAQRDAGDPDPEPAGLHRIGTLAAVRQAIPDTPETVRLVVEGLERVRLESVAVPPGGEGATTAFCARLADPPGAGAEPADLSSLVRLVWERAGHLVRVRRLLGADQLDLAALPAHLPDRFADLLASLLLLPLDDKQALLETVAVAERLKKLAYLIQPETEIAELERKLQQRVRRQMERQ